MKRAFARMGLLVGLVLPMLGFIAPAAHAQASGDTNWHYKTANEKWTWMEDYVFLYANYIVACETGRQCQVGMGVFAWDEPRGEKIRFSGQKEILTVGAGAIYIRADDGKGPVKAAFIRKQSGLIPIIDKQF